MTASNSLEIPIVPSIDPENPLYCPEESASKYLKSILANGSRIRKTKRHNHPTKGRKEQGAVSSFVKMLAQVVVSKQKGKFREELGLPLSEISTDHCHNYGTPAKILPALRRPIRRTRKDRAAQVLLKLAGSALIREDLSPELNSISISLPQVPVDDFHSPSSISTISLSNSVCVDVSTESLATKIESPLAPPGLAQVKMEPWEYDGSPRSQNLVQSKQLTLASAEQKKRKRSLEEAFPELLTEPAKFARSFVCEQTKIDGHHERHERSTDLRSLGLDLQDLKAIDRGKKLLLKLGNSPFDSQLINERVNIAPNNSRKAFIESPRRFGELVTWRGDAIGAETPRGYDKLVQRLDEMIPGIRLGVRLAEFRDGCVSIFSAERNVKVSPHQAAADLLAAEGLLNEPIINVFRTSEITRLNLGPSLSEEGGLNLGGRAIWNVFTRPCSFLFLSELSFNNTAILDMDLVRLSGLPKLAVVHLVNTGISDEGVFHLTALKLTLTHLHLSRNPRITDDAVPALSLCILSKLRYLDILGTNIGMPGLRRMAKIIQREERIVDVEIPEECDRYIDVIPNLYLLDIQPPLITSPSWCSTLSAAALQRNLEAHADVANKYHRTKGPLIFTGGTKEEMCERLRELLVRRESDLLVWGMIYGFAEVHGGGQAANDDTKTYLAAQAAARDAFRRLR
ncbi:hypothetical protein D9757_005899 [Collybiopsis confluens]|uniref:Uncharacterized protein n=1 Tax=Collybiopsis confluens TaxID=2823264 RepID=A0A8H5MAH2_9AGAR|nr:hypothetical protein D9757_005899 [Collybiopsis confluens]